MSRDYYFVAWRAANRCEYCRAPEVAFNFPFEVEHIIPLSREGSQEDGNLALSCRSCNVFKSDCLTGFDEMTQSEAQLFHPRLDRWDEHFQVNLATGMIEGLTAAGRATAACLRMNSTSQVRARLQWIRFGLFP
ncbi:MAG TPA: HNH endonuclease signature motif containing protein [Blastocatellia bacterium]|nr:HNH endonuclease signature motif containing protein [Blastocatellia bacterium]